MIKKTTIITIILLLYSLPLIAQELNAEQIYDQYKDAVVMIKSIGFDGRPRGQGSGIIINDSGYVVTNYHNFSKSERLIVEHFGKRYSGDLIIGADVIRDLLVIKLNGKQFPHIKQADLSKVKVGQKIFTLGSPLGLENTLSEGIISKFGYYPQFNRTYIQITAPISHGSSGGAVINTQGELIGISSYGLDGGQNLNFAIPIDELMRVNLLSVNDKKSLSLLNLYYRGINARDANDYDKSIKIFKEFIKIDSNYAPIYYNVGLAYENLNLSDSAITFFELTIGKDSQFVLAYNELGYVYTSLGDYTKAENLYSEAIRLNPKFAGAYNNLGAIYIYIKEYDKALLLCQEALKLNKFDIETYSNLALVFKYKKEFDNAINYLKVALEIDPNSALLHYNLGSIYFAKGDYYKTIDCDLKATKLNDNFLKAFVTLGSAHLKLEEYDNAIHYYNRVIYLHKSSIEEKRLKNSGNKINYNTSDLTQTYYGLGQAYYYKNDFNKAIHFCGEGLRIDSNAASLYSGLAFAFREKKDSTKALYYFNKTVSKDTGYWLCYFEIGNIYLNQKNYELAIENYKNYLKYDNSRPSVLYRIGFAYYSKNQFDISREFLEKLIRIDSTYSNAYNLFATMYIKNHDYELAIKNYLIAIQYDPTNGGFYFNLGTVYLELGKREESLPYIQKAAILGNKLAQEWLSKN